MQPTTIEYIEIDTSQSEDSSSTDQSEQGKLRVAVEIQTGDTFVNVTSIDDSFGMSHVNDTYVGNYTEYDDYGNYTDYYNYTDYMYNDTYYYDNVTYEYYDSYDDQYYESYDTVYYDEYNVDDDVEEEDVDEVAPTRLTYEQMLSSPPPRGTFNLQMALIDSRNHGYGKDCKNSGSSRPKVKNNFISDALWLVYLAYQIVAFKKSANQ